MRLASRCATCAYRLYQDTSASLPLSRRPQQAAAADDEAGELEERGVEEPLEEVPEVLERRAVADERPHEEGTLGAGADDCEHARDAERVLADEESQVRAREGERARASACQRAL